MTAATPLHRTTLAVWLLFYLMKIWNLPPTRRTILFVGSLIAILFWDGPWLFRIQPEHRRIRVGPLEVGVAQLKVRRCSSQTRKLRYYTQSLLEKPCKPSCANKNLGPRVETGRMCRALERLWGFKSPPVHQFGTCGENYRHVKRVYWYNYALYRV